MIDSVEDQHESPVRIVALVIFQQLGQLDSKRSKCLAAPNRSSFLSLQGIGDRAYGPFEQVPSRHTLGGLNNGIIEERLGVAGRR